MGTPAVFLDRDGTITREVGYINHVDRLELEPDAVAGLRRLQAHGLKLVVVTNQTGAARGLHPLDLIEVVNGRLRELLRAGGVTLDAVYCCPHHPDVGEPPLRRACECRKPKPGLILRAAADLDIDLSRSYMVGDKLSDVRCAQNAGVKGVLVLTGYGKGEFTYLLHTLPRPPATVSATLRDAAQWILCDLGLEQPAFADE